MHAQAHTCMHIYVHACINMHKHVYLCMYANVYVYVCTRMHIHACTYTFIYLYAQACVACICLHRHVHVNLHPCRSMSVHTRTDRCAHTHINAHTPVHTETDLDVCSAPPAGRGAWRRCPGGSPPVPPPSQGAPGLPGRPARADPPPPEARGEGGGPRGGDTDRMERCGADIPGSIQRGAAANRSARPPSAFQTPSQWQRGAGRGIKVTARPRTWAVAIAACMRGWHGWVPQAWRGLADTGRGLAAKAPASLIEPVCKVQL